MRDAVARLERFHRDNPTYVEDSAAERAGQDQA